MRVIFILSTLILSLFASFDEGKKVFDTKCSSCHKEYISMNLLKDNFFDKNNTLLNLKAPSANLIAWAMLESSNKIGDENDREFQEIEIENFLRSYLENPDRFNSICDENVLPYYDNKPSMKGELSDEEYMNLAIYFLEFKDNIKEKDIYKEPKYSIKEEENILKKAKDENRNIIVYATSSTCYFCKKMDREVFKDIEVKNILEKNYIFVEIDMDNSSLPFDLNKEYKRITPSFFFIDSNKKLLNQYPGAWIKSDFIKILMDNK